MSIIKRIHSLASVITEEDLDDWVVPQLVSYYDLKLKRLATKAFGHCKSAEGSKLQHEAFAEGAKECIRKACHTFIFKAKHWKSNRDINSYLITTLNRFADITRYEVDGVKKTVAPICPACKEMGKREYLLSEDGQLRCLACTKELNEIQWTLRKLTNEDKKSTAIPSLRAKERFFSMFAKHSRKGYRCPDCGRFIPDSSNGEFGISCVYNDCFWVGNVSELEIMNHPLGQSERKDVSLFSVIGKNNDSSKDRCLQDVFSSNDVNQEVAFSAQQTFNAELSILNEVIDEQINLIKRTNPPATILQKTLMYNAFKVMTEKHPSDMVSYLVHRKQVSDVPIQSKIFQEYVKLMQDSLPCVVVRAGVEYDILSLMDPVISLFLGISEFDANVRADYSIPNNTNETYVGGRQFKDYGPCFIGLILDVVDVSTGNSLKNNIIDYNFVQINMDKTIAPGTKVHVKHYRIPSHYEMGSLVYLQRARKKIVNRVKFKLNKDEKNSIKV